MCGIIATVGYTKTDVYNMLETIAHRGKYNRGIKEFSWGDRKVILGHNRLAINDTSAAGNQPMEWEGIHLVVHGEIWNYPELRKEYEERGELDLGELNRKLLEKVEELTLYILQLEERTKALENK